MDFYTFQTIPSILSSWHFLFASGLKPASFGKVVGKRRKVLPESLNIIISLVLFWIFFGIVIWISLFNH